MITHALHPEFLCHSGNNLSLKDPAFPPSLYPIGLSDFVLFGHQFARGPDLADITLLTAAGPRPVPRAGPKPRWSYNRSVVVTADGPPAYALVTCMTLGRLSSRQTLTIRGGYYIAADGIRPLAKPEIRTGVWTHMGDCHQAVSRRGDTVVATPEYNTQFDQIVGLGRLFPALLGGSPTEITIFRSTPESVGVTRLDLGRPVAAVALAYDGLTACALHYDPFSYTIVDLA